MQRQKCAKVSRKYSKVCKRQKSFHKIFAYLHVYCKVCNKKLMLSTLKSNLFILLKMLSNIYYFILFICHAHTTFQQPPPWLFRCQVRLNNRPQSLNPPIASSLPCFLTFSLTFPPPHLTRRRRPGPHLQVVLSLF